MKITILKENLKEGINIVERVAGHSLTLPILNNILVSVEKNFLNLAATDLEIGINFWTLVKTEKEGKIAVPAKIISGLIGFLPEKPINLEISDLSFKVEADNYQTTIKGFNPDDFPIIPKISEGENVSVKSQLFCQSLSQVVDIASLSSTKPEISGVYFLFQKNLITMTATDSFRLGEKKIPIKAENQNFSKEYSFILPQRAAKEVINIFGEKEGDLVIRFSPNQILFETGGAEATKNQIQLISRLIEGEYPNYQEIIPKTSEIQIVLPKNDFINQVKAASLFSDKINEVKLRIDPKKNKVEFFSQNPDLGEHKSYLSGKVEGKPLEISFNHRFLLDGLLNIKSQDVVFELTNSEKPGVLRPKNDDNYLYLVMPIKTT